MREDQLIKAFISKERKMNEVLINKIRELEGTVKLRKGTAREMKQLKLENIVTNTSFLTPLRILESNSTMK